MGLNINTKWQHINDMLPQEKKYVLVETRFCKYPFITAYYNGIEFIDVYDKSVLANIRYWADIKLPNEL